MLTIKRFASSINRRIITQRIHQLPFKQTHYVPDKYKKFLQEEIVKEMVETHPQRRVIPRLKSKGDLYLDSIHGRYGIDFQQKLNIKTVRFNARILQHLQDFSKSLPSSDMWALTKVETVKRRETTVYWKWIPGNTLDELVPTANDVQEMLDNVKHAWTHQLTLCMDLRTPLIIQFKLDPNH
jgi:hypothetical protein